MRRAFQFVVALILGLGLLTWVASIIVNETTRGWFEKDLSLRAQLVVSGARQALISHWRKEQRADLRDLLVEITHDERIMAAAACTADLTLLTRTPDYPGAVRLRRARETRPLRTPANPASGWHPWNARDAAARRQRSRQRHAS